MSFSSPENLLWLLAIPLLVALLWVRHSRRHHHAARWTSPELMPNLVDRPPGRKRWLPLAILLVALAALIVGVARPHATVSVRRQEATVMLAIDTSRSMGASDIAPSRLAAAQDEAYRFLNLVPKTFRVGLVSFSTRAQLALAPTTDRNLARQAISALQPTEGTAIGDAILLAAKEGQKQRTHDGVIPPASILMISDGARDGGHTSPTSAAQQAAKLHVPVYTIVVGTANGVVHHALPGGYMETIQVPASPKTLQTIAHDSGGLSFTAATNAQLRDVYKRLASRLGHKNQSREITDLFAGGGAVLLLMGSALSVLWFRRIV
jgi:Ca-activated chloride channel family protein